MKTKLSIRRFSKLALALWICVLGIAVPVLADNEPAPTEESDPEREVLIMSRVLEESLNRSALAKDWQGIPIGTSVFEPVIKAQYIPTVGAIFSFSVSFPLKEPPPVPPAPEEKSKDREQDKDLWEKFTKEPEISLDSDALKKEIENKVTHDLQKNMTQLKVDVHKLQEMTPLPPGQSNPELMFLGEPMPGFEGNVPDIMARTTAYDKEKVDVLRKTILSALAQYGHRLKSLKDSERVLVVIESPKFSQASVSQDPGSKAVTEYKKALIYSQRPGGHYFFRDSNVSLSKDHYLLSLKKKDLDKEKTGESLEGSVDEMIY